MSPENLGDFGFHEVRFSGPIIDAKDLRSWWHDILRHDGHYKGYFFFLTLPSDEEANKYLREFGEELHLITGKKLLVVILTDVAILREDFDKDFLAIAVNNQIGQGYSLQIAEQFGVKIGEFPCILFFENPYSAEHILFKLKQLTKDEIAKNVRGIVDAVNAAADNQASPTTALKEFLREVSRKKIKNEMVGLLRELPEKTLSVAIETWLKTIIH